MRKLAPLPCFSGSASRNINTLFATSLTSNSTHQLLSILNFQFHRLFRLTPTSSPFVWQKEVTANYTIKIDTQRRRFILIVHYITRITLLNLDRSKVDSWQQTEFVSAKLNRTLTGLQRKALATEIRR